MGHLVFVFFGDKKTNKLNYMNQNRFSFRVLLLFFIFLTISIVHSNAQVVTVGTATTTISTNAAPSPYYTWYTTNRVQYLILASELNALGLNSSKDFASIGFNVVAQSGSGVTCTGGSLSLNTILNFAIKMKNTSAVSISGSYDNTGLTTVFSSPSYVMSTGWNTHIFSNTFTWDGTSNILVDVCHDNTNGSATSCYVGSPSIYYTSTPFSSTVQLSADGVGSYCGSAATTNNTSSRANMQLAVSSFYNTDSVITIQDSSQVRLGTINAPILKIATYVSGTKGAQRRATQLSFNTNGTTNLSDISNARVFYTGGSPNFDSSFQ